MKHLIAVAVLLGSLAAQTAPVTPAKITYLRCGILIDGKSDAPQKNVVVRVAGEKIEAVGAAAPEAGADVIDLGREVCLPGLIDTHTHVLLQGDITAEDYDLQLLKSSTPYRTILGTVSARRALEYGFTTIRDLETEGAGYADVDIRNAIDNGVIPGPRMQVSGRAMDVTGAYPLLGYSWELKVPKAYRKWMAPRADARRCASRFRTAWTRSRCTAIAVTGCVLTACSTTFRRSRWKS
jgi:imidazolonepropionase-like amidohydrolase